MTQTAWGCMARVMALPGVLVNTKRKYDRFVTVDLKTRCVHGVFVCIVIYRLFPVVKREREREKEGSGLLRGRRALR